MPRYGAGRKVPLPTAEEIAEAVREEREIVACSAEMQGPQTFLKVAFHNGDISTVLLQPLGAANLLSALKSIVPDTPHMPFARVTDSEGRRYLQQGDMSA